MEDATAAESNNMDESLELESRLVQAVHEGNICEAKDLLEEQVKRMRFKVVKERIQFFWKLFNNCINDFKGEENYDISHESSSALQSSMKNYLFFRLLVTKLQEDDAIKAREPILSHEFLFTEFKSVRYKVPMAAGSVLAKRIARAIRLHQKNANLKILQLANAPDNNKDLEMAKCLFREQLERVRQEMPKFRCTFFESMLDLVYTQVSNKLR